MFDIKFPDPPTSLSLISLNGFCGHKAPCFLTFPLHKQTTRKCKPLSNITGSAFSSTVAEGSTKSSSVWRHSRQKTVLFRLVCELKASIHSLVTVQRQTLTSVVSDGNLSCAILIRHNTLSEGEVKVWLHAGIAL